MNEEKNLKKNEKKSRKKNPKSVTTDKHLNHNAKKKTRNETSPLIIFGISFITSLIVNIALSFALVPTITDKIADDLVKASAKAIIEEKSNDKNLESSIKEGKKTRISCTVAYKYNDKTVEFLSPVSCYINFELEVISHHGSSLSTNKYGPIELIAGEKKTLSLDNLSKFDYPKNSKINFVNVTNTFVYGDSPLDSKSYSLSTSNIEINSYSDGIELATTEDTLASFTVIIKDGNFIGFIDAELLPIYADSTNAFSINDLASNFFSDKATIYTYSSISVCSYEKDN